jgi:hypothetical protein
VARKSATAVTSRVASQGPRHVGGAQLDPVGDLLGDGVVPCRGGGIACLVGPTPQIHPDGRYRLENAFRYVVARA